MPAAGPTDPILTGLRAAAAMFLLRVLDPTPHVTLVAVIGSKAGGLADSEESWLPTSGAEY